MMHRTILPLLLSVLLFAAGCSSGASGEEAADEERSVRVETLILEPTVFEDMIEMTGTVEAIDDATLSAQASGTIEQLVPRGQTVGQGAVVALLDDDEAAAAVQQAQAQLESARAQAALAQDTYERMEPLYRDSVISASEFESVRAQYNQARASVSQAQAALAQARKRLENTRIRSPFAGTVEEHFVERGEQVAPGETVVRVVNIDPAQIRTGVPERYANDIERGTTVEAVFNAYGGQRRTGEVTFVGSTINPQNRTFPVEIQIDNTNRQLKPEMTARLYLPRAVIEGALIVPRSAIIRDETGTHVYLVEQERRTDDESEQATTVSVARRRSVTAGPSQAERVVVETGLTAGDEVVITGQNNLAPGDPVDVAERYRTIPGTEPSEEGDLPL